MRDKLCPYCELDTAGQHAYGCPGDPNPRLKVVTYENVSPQAQRYMVIEAKKLQALERVVEAARVVHARYIGFSACMETDMAKLEKALAALEGGGDKG
jgi:hypothetical protein